MAKKKSAKRKPATRRRKVGAAALNASNPMLMYGSVAGGFFLGDKINEQVDKFAGTIDKKIIGAAEGGIGAALVFMKLGKKKTVVEVVAGSVLLGAGVRRLLKEFGIMNGIGGYQTMPVLAGRQVNGYGKVPVIGNYRTNSQALNGVFNGGLQVPRPLANQIMGSTDSTGRGSGYSNNGSSCMG